jgi:DNA-binding MarR family transcriptional regulator
MWQRRRARARFFPDRLFADPAWDMLLHLYATELFGARTTVSNTLEAASVPHATALRHLQALIREGLCDRRPDLTDGRRHFVNLTAGGRKAMDSYFAAVGDPSRNPLLV